MSTADLPEPRCAYLGNTGSISDISVRQPKFVAAIQADLVRPLVDCEHAADVTVMTAKRELGYPMQRVHRS
jgi:hypothetical protein